jgi:hypothetical protein
VHIDFAIQEKETTEKMTLLTNASEFPADTKVLLFFNYQ